MVDEMDCRLQTFRSKNFVLEKDRDRRSPLHLHTTPQFFPMLEGMDCKYSLDQKVEPNLLTVTWMNAS